MRRPKLPTDQAPPRSTSEPPQETHNELMSITASSPAESDASEFDGWLGVLPDLVRDGADLSKHLADSSVQSLEEIFAAEELLPELDDNGLDLLCQGEAIPMVESSQRSRVLTPMPTPLNLPALADLLAIDHLISTTLLSSSITLYANCYLEFLSNSIRSPILLNDIEIGINL